MNDNDMIRMLRKKLTESELKFIKLQIENDALKKLLSPRQERIAINKILPIDKHPYKPVSYTHLTLPTIYSV